MTDRAAFWAANLALFFLALAGLIAALLAGQRFWAGASVAVMAITFVAGLLFTARVPHAHPREQQRPLQHEEVVLMVDVSPERVHEVEQLVSRRHPEAGIGGVGWHIRGLNA